MFNLIVETIKSEILGYERLSYANFFILVFLKISIALIDKNNIYLHIDNKHIQVYHYVYDLVFN